MNKGEGWECGIFTQRHIEWLHKLTEELQSELDREREGITHLKRTIMENEARQTEAAVMPTSAEMHESMLSSTAHHLSKLSRYDYERVVGMARAWGANMTYAQDLDPVKHLALEVAQLDGYALGAFMQYLMEFGNRHKRVERE